MSRNPRSATRSDKGIADVMLAELQCILSTLRLILSGQISQPRGLVGREVTFADGTRSVVYRETAMRHRRDDGLVLMTVRFRLRFIGSSRLMHRLFRFESLFNTLLFAAHEGFETKLWMTDERTWFYRGLYEWRGAEAARDYAETLRVVLRPWVELGSFGYRIIEDESRPSFLAGSAAPMTTVEDGWWCPANSLPPRLEAR